MVLNQKKTSSVHLNDNWPTKFFDYYDPKDKIFNYGIGGFTFVSKDILNRDSDYIKQCLIILPVKKKWSHLRSKGIMVELTVRLPGHENEICWFTPYWDATLEGSDKLTLKPSIGDNGHTIHCFVENGYVRRA